MNLLYVEIKGSRGAHMIICILRVIFGQIFISLFIDHHRWFLKWAKLHVSMACIWQSLVFSLTETPRTWSPNGMSSALGEGHLDAYLLERYDDIGMFIRCRITLSILTNGWLIESSIRMNSGPTTALNANYSSSIEFLIVSWSIGLRTRTSFVVHKLIKYLCRWILSCYAPESPAKWSLCLFFF